MPLTWDREDVPLMQDREDTPLTWNREDAPLMRDRWSRRAIAATVLTVLPAFVGGYVITRRIAAARLDGEAAKGQPLHDCSVAARRPVARRREAACEAQAIVEQTQRRLDD